MKIEARRNLMVGIHAFSSPVPGIARADRPQAQRCMIRVDSSIRQRAGWETGDGLEAQ
jgi:hypothetical protein